MSTATVQNRVRESIASGAPLRICGSGGWLDAGRPVHDAAPLSLADDDEIVEYVPGDLTLIARAGATLASIARATSAEGQWLALDPHGEPTGTIGATIATASAGPLSHAFGTPRDAVLGLEVVTGAGEVVRAGGRVVKNVAGFDLTRLFTGAWGTLAVITEATVRLRARPERDETLAIALPNIDVPGAPEAIEALLAKLSALPFSPLALEMLNGALAASLGLECHARVLARFGGNDDSVRAQRQMLGALGDTAPVSSAVWSRFAECEAAGAAVVRVSAQPSRLHALWARLAGDESGTLAHATVGRGVVRCIRPSSTPGPIAPWLERIARSEGTPIFERLPPASWGAVPSRVNDPLSRRVHAAFDPARILNRGILGEQA